MQYEDYTHVHLTEREADGTYEDCSWASAVEFARSVGQNAPATRAEYEALRLASGDIATPGNPGSNLWDVERGMKKRYGWAGTIGTGTGHLTVGRSAIVTGSMGVWPVGSKWRRWDADFAGNHAVAVFRLDSLARIWWCDPLAPTGWNGEWMPMAELQKFMAPLGSRLMYADMNSRRTPMVGTVTATKFEDGKAARVSIPAGTTVHGYDPTRPGAPVKSATWATGSACNADARCFVTWTGTTNPPVPKGGPFLRIIDGFYAGLLIVEAVVRVAEPQDSTPYDKADLDRARAEGKAAGATENEAKWEGWVATHP